MPITVLRLGHRRERDKRATTHCALVSRAFGADRIAITGDMDEALLENIDSVTKRFGGNFSAEYVKGWKSFLKGFRGTKVHLTMYGLPIQDCIQKLKGNDLCVIIGGEKVPSEVYELADYNISITNQPHSEIAALALFLDRYFSGTELEKEFENYEMKIIPSPKTKKVVRKLK